MKSFWLFRTNLRQLEYYHDYTNLEEFKQNCHDFYLLQGIWFLENDVFDEVVIWRLAPKNTAKEETVFEVNGKQFIQRFVDDFDECFDYPSPAVTFFRGGFPEYGELTKIGFPELGKLARMRSDFFGLSLYCGTGQRVVPQRGGIYSKILVEDERDLRNGNIPFYKTANQEIFKPSKFSEFLNVFGPEIDICWPCNFSQLDYKGQEYFIKAVSQSDYLRGLKILHVGNMPEVGKKLCKRYNVSNIEFAGHVSRPGLNSLLNYSNLGLVTSDLNDGSPRVITEIMASGTPLLLRDKTRALNYYRKNIFVTPHSDSTLVDTVRWAIENHEELTKAAVINREQLSMDAICKLNLVQWGLT